MEYKSDSPVYQEDYYHAPERDGFGACALILVCLVCGLLVIVGYPAATIPAVLALVVYYRSEK